MDFYPLKHFSLRTFAAFFLRSKGNLELAQWAHRETIAARIAVLNIVLTTPKALKDVPLVSYQVQNLGALTVSDIHTWFSYTIEEPTQKIPIPVSQNNETTSVGTNLVPGDHIDKEQVLLPGIAAAQASFQRLISRAQGLTITVDVDFTESDGSRSAKWSKFFYVALSSKFERMADCPAVDRTSSFRASSSERAAPKASIR